METPRILIFTIGLVKNVMEMLLSLRIILKLFGAAPSVSFVNWVYITTAPLLNPFAGIFPSPELEGGFVIEFSALFALIIYSFAGYFLIQSVRSLMEDSKQEAKKA